MTTTKIKALSIKQPWAYWIAKGWKTIEVRSWKTNHRGPLLIVSSKRPDKDMPRSSYCWHGPYGHALAIASLKECRPMHRADEEAAMRHGRGCEGMFAWVLSDIRRIKKPFPVKGRLNLYDVEIEEDLLK